MTERRNNDRIQFLSRIFVHKVLPALVTRPISNSTVLCTGRRNGIIVR